MPETKVDEIADGIFRFSTVVPEVAPPAGFTFNQFLIAGDEPLLFHTGPRAMFPLVSEAVATVLPPSSLRWITFGHVESDECGSMNDWLATAPQATVAHGAIGCDVSLNDLADRPPRRPHLSQWSFSASFSFQPFLCKPHIVRVMVSAPPLRVLR